MVRTPIVLAPIAVDTNEGVLSSWLVKVGTQVEVSQVVAEVESMKVVIEVAAPVAGTMSSLEVSEGEEVQVGQVLAWIE